MTLPNGWTTTTIADCQARTRSLDPRKFGGETFDLFSVPSYSHHRPDLVLGGEIGSTKQEVQEGDVLLCKIVPHIRRAWRVPRSDGRRQIASSEWIVFRDHGLEPEYLRRFVLSDGFHEQFMRTVSGVGGSLMRARPAEAGRIEVPVPPLPEQRRIVAKLDGLVARLVRARAELHPVPALASTLRRKAASLVLDAPGASEVRFTTVLDYKGGSQPPKSTFHSEPGEGRIRLLQIRDFASDKKAVYITDNGRWPRCTADDIMIGRYGASVGKVLTGKSGAYNVALVKMIFDKTEIHPRFLLHWLMSATFQDRLQEISRSAQDGFNKDDLADLPFPLLPLTDQTMIASLVDATLARANRLEAEATRSRALLERLEAALFTRAFRGELVPRDPQNQPANAIVAGIRAERSSLRPLAS